MLKAYFDASGTDGSSSLLTLAGMVASESVWRRFELEWNALLDSYGVQCFHASDAKALQGAFRRESGWNDGMVSSLEKDLWMVIARFRATKQFESGSNLLGSSCSVSREDYERAKSDRPQLRSREAICLNYCFNVLPRDLDSEKTHPDVILVFDQNEEFMKTIYRNWINYRNHVDAGWPSQIKAIEKGNTSKDIPLQAVDLLAWSINRHQRVGYHRGFIAPFLIALHKNVYTYDSLVERFPNG
jgi:hypothetical protein